MSYIDDIDNEEEFDEFEADAFAFKRFVPSFNARFWESSHKPNFSLDSPEAIKEAGIAYFEWCDKNPIKEQNWVGKDGKEVAKFKPRAFTIGGFSTFIGRSVGFIQNKEREWESKAVQAKTEEERKHYLDMLEAMQWVRDCISRQKYEGAASGYFHPGLVGRDLFGDSVTIKGDKESPIQIDHNGNISVNVASMTEDELRKLASGEI